MAKHFALTRERILEFFRARQGARIANKAVADAFGMPPAAARKLLNDLVMQGELLHEHSQSGHGRQYYMPLAHEAMRKHMRTFGGFKEYRPGPEWDYVNQRLAEFRAIKSKFSDD
jgi:predicted ArsR family transcriptional regulator